MEKGIFLTTNTRLDGDKERPKMFSKSNFESWWRELHYSQRKYLLLKSGVEETDIKYETILKAYKKQDRKYYVVFYGLDARWACNLFVREALFLGR